MVFSAAVLLLYQRGLFQRNRGVIGNDFLDVSSAWFFISVVFSTAVLSLYVSAWFISTEVFMEEITE